MVSSAHAAVVVLHTLGFTQPLNLACHKQNDTLLRARHFFLCQSRSRQTFRFLLIDRRRTLRETFNTQQRVAAPVRTAEKRLVTQRRCRIQKEGKRDGGISTGHKTHINNLIRHPYTHTYAGMLQ